MRNHRHAAARAGDHRHVPASGRAVRAVVQVGDHVEVGQVIGDSDQFVSAPVHASVSGTVSAVTTLLLPGGRTTKALVIDSDGEQRVP